MESFNDIEPKHKSSISAREYLSYLPSKIEKDMESNPPTAVYYQAPPDYLADFFSRSFQERTEKNKIIGLIESKTGSHPESPYKSKISHIYSVRSSTIEGIPFYVSIFSHDKFQGSVVLLSIRNKYKIITLKDDIDHLVDDAFSHWANSSEE